VKRSTFEGQTLVYRYGCPHWADLDEEGMRQLRLAHDLRNELVAIEKRYEAMVAAIWLSFPQVAAAQTRVDEATATVEQLAGEMLEARKRARSTVPDPDAKARLVEARKVRTAAKADLKATKDTLKPAMREHRAELDAAKRCASGGCRSAKRCTGECAPGCHHRCPDPTVLRLYDVWSERGLGSGTYTRVHDQHQTATTRIVSTRKNGEPVEHRFHGWRGEGTLTVQIGFGARVFDDWWALDEGRPAKEWLGRDRRVHEQASGKRRTLRLRIGRSRKHDGPYWLELPVVMHRDLPEGVQVRWVQVTRRTVAGSPRLSVSLTLRLPAVPEKATGEVVDVDFGWASGGSAVGVRVARISTASGKLPPVPADIAEMVTAGDWWELWAPAAWRDLLGRDDAIRADRSELLDDLRPAVAEALSDAELAEQVGFTAAQARVMKFAKYDRLARVWPAEHPLYQRLVAWRLRDRHLWQFEAHERQQVIARRRDAYRKVAAWLTDAARLIAIKDVAVADLRKRPGVDAEDTYEARGSRRQVQFAAPAELRAAIEQAARQRGVEVVHYSTEEGQ
jgi:hypothetical protein